MSELNQSPYKTLGKYLKDLRIRANESLAEASGAVEVDVRELAGYELGKTKPSEDVLLLLISHFGAKDEEAVRLWEVAGYGVDRIPAARMINNESQAPQNSDPDNRILFTDVVDIMVNNYGVVMNFMQSSAGGSQPVARVGMSREHAKSILQILQATLNQTENIIHKPASSDGNSPSAS